MSPATYLIEMPLSFRDYPLHARYAHFNQVAFKSMLPVYCQLGWGPLKRVSGVTYCQHQKIIVQQSSFGQSERREDRIVPGSLKITLNDKLNRTEQEFDAVLLHEMCHAAFFAVEHNFTESHGPRFLKLAAMVSGIVGFTVPRSDDISDAVIPDHVESRPIVGVFAKLQTEWIGCFLSGSGKAAQKIDEVVGAVSRAKFKGQHAEHLTIVQIDSKLGYKYGMGRGSSLTKWSKVSETEIAACRQDGTVLRDIESPHTTLSPDQINAASAKMVVCVLTKDLEHNSSLGEFYLAKLVESPSDLHDLIASKSYMADRRARYSVAIILTPTTLPAFRGIVVCRNVRTRKGYRLSDADVSALWTKRTKVLWESNSRWIDS